MSTASSKVRQLAAEIVCDVAFRGWRFNEAIERHMDGSTLDRRDRSLLYELSAGAVRHGNTLDMLIEHHSDRPLRKIEHAVLSNLRIGAYQIVYLTRIPESAAVNETVESVRASQPLAMGFVNAVLRALIDSVKDKILTITPIGEPGTLLPIRDGWCRFREKFFPDQVSDFEGFFEWCLSYPKPLVKLFIRACGIAHAFGVGRAQNEPAPLYLRVNALKTSEAGFLSRLKREGFKASRGKQDFCIQLDGGCDVTTLPGFAEGHFSVQDEAAQLVAAALDIHAGASVVDLCSAPGGKVTHIAELNPQADILAVDNNFDRIELMQENISRLGLGNIRTVCADAREATSIAGAPFDVVLLDVPCTNTGVYRRRPDARWRYTDEMHRSLTDLQRDLLRSGAEIVKPGGALVYSTCSILLDENEERVEEFVNAHPEFRVEKEKRTFPTSGGSDGGYFAILRNLGKGG